MRNRPLWFKSAAALLAIILLGSGYYIYRIWDAANDAYDPPKGGQSIDGSKPVNLLLLGIDERPGDRGRADSIIIVTLNPRNKTVKLTNIPRDTYVDIPGRNKKDKINHSYAFGGTNLATKTVENFLGIPIDGYVNLNMPGMKTIVDELGGIDVNVPFSFTESGSTYTKGKMKLNGAQALTFSRMRKLDREGDLGRIKRQQEVIRAMIHKGTQMSSILNLDDILRALGDNVKTDIHPFTAVKLSHIYNGIRDQNFTTGTFRGTPFKKNGIYYYRVTDEEVARVRNEIRSFMDKK